MNNDNRLNQFGLTCAVALALAFGFGNAAQAQAGVDNQGYQSNEKGNGIYGDAPAGLDPLDIMHRAQQLNGRSAEEFNQDSQLQIDSSVSDFKRMQQQRILQQQSANNGEGQAVEAVDTSTTTE